jgi:hypothetical protein
MTVTGSRKGALLSWNVIDPEYPYPGALLNVRRRTMMCQTNDGGRKTAPRQHGPSMLSQWRGRILPNKPDVTGITSNQSDAPPM